MNKGEIAMQVKVSCIYFTVAFILVFTLAAHAQMQSENYSIPTSVLSGGGAPMESASFETSSTLGQPSPLMDPADPPYSANYDLYPGFWYALDPGPAGCEDLSSFASAYGAINSEPNYSSVCDYDGDGNVDGSDLAGIAARFE